MSDFSFPPGETPPTSETRHLKPETLNQTPGPFSLRVLICSEKGVHYANWNDWSWQDGSEHGAAASHRRPSVCGLRQVAESSAGVGRGKGGWLLISRGLREKTGQAAGGLVDGPGGGRGSDHRRSPA